MNPALVLALIQAAATYGPAIANSLGDLVADRDDRTDAELLSELDTIIASCKASDARINDHVHKTQR
tara:strand:- start:2014 stop:2214 length:201 start_codon:yes stop_codon:yes gene_type:complete